LQPVYRNSTNENATVGVTGTVTFNSTASLTVAILGSIRTIRDFVEGPSILYPMIQNATKFSQNAAGVSISRMWLDNITETSISFSKTTDSKVSLSGSTITFEAGSYNFSAEVDYPQLTQLSTVEVLNQESRGLIAQLPDQTTSLSFLSYTDKLLAGAWRFLTYFGRDSMISLLLLQPVLSQGEGSAVEAVISAVLERINQTDGSVCHEETIGDYATFLNIQANETSTAPQCDYKMVDSDFYLPIVAKEYFVDSEVGKSRRNAFLAQRVTGVPYNANLTYGDLMLINTQKILDYSAGFAALQRKEALIHLKEGQIVGNWRDSTYGMGGGRIPYDVNTALVPAALRAIAALSTDEIFPGHPDWNSTASEYAQVWEDETLSFFEVRQLSRFLLHWLIRRRSRFPRAMPHLFFKTMSVNQILTYPRLPEI
jgi:hypothetical protein